jgi:NhaP-type Na+/H+ or K+/H+ antiporter
MPDIVIAIFVGCALGFAAGYGVREHMSRQRHRRARDRAGY